MSVGLMVAHDYEMERQMLFDNIDEKLEDSELLVTAKWVSVTFDLPIRQSEQLLEAYFSARTGLSAVFLLCGIRPDGHTLISLVPQNKLDQWTSHFSGKPIKSIYSIQRHQLKNSAALSSADSLLDLTVANLKKLVTIPWSPSEIAHTSLICQQQVPIMTVAPVAALLESTGNDHQIKIKENKNFFAQQPKLATTTATSRQSSKLSSNFFNIRPSAKSDNLAKHDKMESVTHSQELANECDDDFSPLTVRRTSHLKRKRLVFDSDEENDEADTVIHSLIQKDQSIKQKTKVQKQPLTVFAGDSEAESVVRKTTEPRKSAKIVKSPCKPNPSAKLPQRTDVSVGKPIAEKRNRCKRQILKTFTDDDGFMVTEKVWESVSEDEDTESGKDCNNTNISAAPPLPGCFHSTAESTVGLTGAPTVGPAKSDKCSAASSGSKKSVSTSASKQIKLSSFFFKN